MVRKRVLHGEGVRCRLPSRRRPAAPSATPRSTPGYHLYIGRSALPQRQTPNVYASCNSQSLWSLSPTDAVALITHEIADLGGRVVGVKPSRCDMTADFEIPGGLSLDFLLSHRVPHQVKHDHHMSGDALETFYHGAKSSPIQLRIYDKALEVARGGTKWWFYKLWGVSLDAAVWRVEFQLRRPILKQFGIHSLDDLSSRAGSLWRYLTAEWCSLRLPDDSNVTRRTVHPSVP